jgi:hypothetical protein
LLSGKSAAAAVIVGAQQSCANPKSEVVEILPVLGTATFRVRSLT